MVLDQNGFQLDLPDGGQINFFNLNVGTVLLIDPFGDRIGQTGLNGRKREQNAEHHQNKTEKQKKSYRDIL